MKKSLNIRVSEDFKELLDQETEKRRISQTELVIQAVEHFLNCGIEPGQKP